MPRILLHHEICLRVDPREIKGGMVVGLVLHRDIKELGSAKG